MSSSSPPRPPATILLVGALGLSLSLGLPLGSAGCNHPCEKYCKKVETCLSNKQKMKFFTSRAQCIKTCKDWDLEKPAQRCLDKAEGSCFRMMKCMGPAIRSALRERHIKRRRRR